LSISPTFYKQLFQTKVFCTAFLCSELGFVIFWQKNIGAKAAHKVLAALILSMRAAVLVKLHTGVNST